MELPAGGWDKMAALEQLIVTTSRALRELPDDLGEARQLGGEFDLTPLTKLTALPRTFGRLARVTILRLPHGVAAPPEIAGMTGLRELRVRKVAALPEDIGALQELRLLDASETAITRLPASIGGAASLRTLGLSRTELTELPDSVCELAGLRDLDLIQTPIVGLPEAIGRLGLTAPESTDMAREAVEDAVVRLAVVEGLRVAVGVLDAVSVDCDLIDASVGGCAVNRRLGQRLPFRPR